jgi:hypothetical protein
MIGLLRKSCLAAFALTLVSAPGCVRRDGEVLVVATTLPAAERRALEAEFAQRASPGGIPIAWVHVVRDDDLAEALQRDLRIDLVLGGGAAVFERLATEGLLGPAPLRGETLWAIVRRAPIGLEAKRSALAEKRLAPMGGEPATLGRLAQRAPLALDDPRVDPLTLAAAQAALRVGSWASGYADLVRAAGHARPIGRVPGAARASLQRGEAALALAVFPARPSSESAPILPLAGAPEEITGIAIAARAPHRDQARLFLQMLLERGQLNAPPRPDPVALAADTLLADLMGATLVDAQDELRAAWAALGRLQDSELRRQRAAWMATPPPWPPASVSAIRQQPIDEAGAWLETLAEQLAPGAETRQWLLASWRNSPAPVDAATLHELAAAADGQLAADPRFRAWIRAEWSAWARQRYRAAAHTQAEAPPS